MVTREEFLTAAGQQPPRRAPYTFVPLGTTVVPSPWGKEGPDLGRPHKDGICGTIELKWQLEQPMLIGGANNNEPVKFNDRYIIPGASQRGLFRSFLEVATNAHLDLIDDDRFGIRDLQAVNWKKHAAKWDPPGAGWLIKADDGSVMLRTCEHEPVPVCCICALLDIDEYTWHTMSLAERHAEMRLRGLNGIIDLERLGPAFRGKKGTLVVAGLIKSVVEGQDAKKKMNQYF